MFEFFLNDKEKAYWNEARDFVKNDISTELIRDMDAGKIETGRPLVEKAGAKNLLGARFPVNYGGRSLNWTAEVAAVEEVGVLGTSLSCAFVMPSIVGEALNLFGSDTLKEKYLKPTNQGILYSAEALTEPRGGSDFFGATTMAVRDGDHYILNGEKRFVVGAQDSDYFLVYAKSAPDAAPHESISCFIVERAMGVTVQSIYNLLGTRGGGTGRLVFKDVKVPIENVVGKLHGAYQIFNRMMIPERLLSGAGAVGMGRAAIEVAARYSTRRKAFGSTINNFQAVSFIMADAVASLDAARSLVFAAARLVDSGGDGRRLVSEAKKVGTESAWMAINNAMQMMGGIGYTTVYPIERFLRDCRLAMIWTGTNQIMNLLIQHEYYKELNRKKGDARDVEFDAISPDEEEKNYG
ncbi:MAG: acyl-CoA dehydrogenase [Deltaproteobacteria bacterium CG_4_8_14_3_um_filter_51_11]|nr:acyl-CoA/acyl-ACP dehydrogenase [bacterium]OIP40095.1 MAG: acyl-CoA dehydrogenase [Desulfobacteraceae bacterium CG2_30_51_40]PIP45740.1 MAG: acyl-CoA dehydrogenase [Deltaproteobacteria bacterium CG23_combo_of_CG06-09_8_20_14_all_51_20]PIX18374.1 MAG: acyl-CoA dehydrogenase [Deltaproteobacteria bacterium CG_4_8_14_3_um_filter_51_11]PIY21464.1 MAG: acyl-CoA dehydrogenase [Deltaproteobacteria bacterium CG_4_10_14_3_um_filter_51_14]PJB36129.1 MAG: acyl-CoA dehydrogenase [Deltaproteobacteria bac